MVFRIVAIALEDAPQRPGRSQVGAPAMIFKTHQRTAVPTDGNVADAAWRARPFMDGPGIEDAEAAHIGSIGRAIIMREQLVAAADCQNGHIILDSRPQPDALCLEQVLCDGRLLSILSSANKQQIILVRGQSIADAEADDAQRDAAPLTALAQ